VQAFDDFVRGRALRPVFGPEQVATLERGVLSVARALR
jgi:UDP-glucose 4-epimerase